MQKKICKDFLSIQTHDTEPNCMGKYSGENFTGDYVERSHAATLARLLDSAITLPGGFRIGLDGIIGLIPGVGDAVSALFSLIIMQEAYRRRVPKMILVRMAINILIDTLVGAIPILGDVFDFFWKANIKNARLLEDYNYTPQRTYRKATFTSVLVLVAAIIALCMLGWAAWSLGQLLFSGIAGALN
jgi:hypothetical protein